MICTHAHVTLSGSFQTTGISMLEPNLQQGLPKSDAVRSLQGFSPFEEQTRPSFIFEEPGKFAGSSTGSHQELREHVPFTPVAEHGSFQDVSSDNGVGLSTSKGSRFAKFFDGKGRDGAISVAKPQGPIGFPSSSPGPGPGQRQEHFNAAMGGLTDHRAMDDIYAMLNNSSQVSTNLPCSSSFLPSLVLYFDNDVAEPKRRHRKYSEHSTIPRAVSSTSAA